MSSKKRIVIQHTDGKFYDFFVNDESEQWVIDLLKYPNHILSPNIEETTNLDFPIGSRVYFQGIGWTEVVGNDHNSCEYCVFDEIDECFGNCDCRIFKGMNEVNNTSSNKYYVISLAFGDVSDEYATEKEARQECERKAKAEPNVTFSVMKVIDSCCAESVVKWYEK